MKIFITGIAGFLGGHIAKNLLEQGHEVSGCDNLIGGYVENVPEDAEFFQVDAIYLNQMKKMTKGVDVIIHTACTAYSAYTSGGTISVPGTKSFRLQSYVRDLLQIYSLDDTPPVILSNQVDSTAPKVRIKDVYFMESVLKVKQEWRDKIPAVVHDDGTARLQTVDQHMNSEFYDLIKQFEIITGIPLIINTSFNLNGEPNVETPQDAIRTFYSCGMDMVVIGDYIIEK